MGKWDRGGNHPLYLQTPVPKKATIKSNIRSKGKTQRLRSMIQGIKETKSEIQQRVNSQRQQRSKGRSYEENRKPVIVLLGNPVAPNSSILPEPSLTKTIIESSFGVNLCSEEKQEMISLSVRRILSVSPTIWLPYTWIHVRTLIAFSVASRSSNTTVH